ncbi:MAG: class I mannose-6-phosphate isomerase [Clostridia bacterium]|nr:class I mannose-6-phosphate isomerase [Clostridia bacterium]
MLYPLKMLPYFRHGEETPWGGRALGDYFGKPIPDDRTGESLEISALPGRESTVENGPLAGMNLAAILEKWGKELTGDAEGFPLLLKLLDAREMLSVQVHPDDAYASAHENGKLGKTEAWLVIAAERGAKLVYGVNAADSEELRALVEAGKLEESLRWVNVQPGDVLYIPHGCVHALGGGIVIYEIQQSSDVTYRFWDWGRVGKDGQPRALHTQAALDVSRPELKLDKLPGATLITTGGSRTAYISDANFELWRLNVAGDMPLESGRMLLLTSLGEAEIKWSEGSFPLAPGESCLVPAALEGVCVCGRTAVMCATTPDRPALREALGYRAELVAGLTKDI